MVVALPNDLLPEIKLRRGAPTLFVHFIFYWGQSPTRCSSAAAWTGHLTKTVELPMKLVDAVAEEQKAKRDGRSEVLAVAHVSISPCSDTPPAATSSCRAIFSWMMLLSSIWCLLWSWLEQGPDERSDLSMARRCGSLAAVVSARQWSSSLAALSIRRAGDLNARTSSLFTEQAAGWFYILKSRPELKRRE